MQRDVWKIGESWISHDISSTGRSPMLCRHCHHATISRPRKLCWVCYNKPAIRDLYPPSSKYARRGSGNYFAQAPLPIFATLALPGTPEKIAIMAQRVQERRQVFHPHDATLERVHELATVG